jgi:predicted nucleic acid-binding protein
MSDEPALVDANVLVYALYADAEHHTVCRQLLDRANHIEAGLHTSLPKFFQNSFR